MKKKILTLVFTLVLLIGLVAAVGMNASAATTYTARNRLSYVNTADNLWNYVAQSYTGDVIALSGNITYDDKNDAEPYILPFGAQGDMVLDLNGYTLDITTRADALVELDYGTTRLHIVNSRPDVPAKIIMRTKVGNSSMIDISKKECGVYVYEGVELVMGKEGDMAEAYRQTSVISATEFSDIAVYGGNLTNNIANGAGIVLESDDSVQFNNSTVTLHGGAKVTAKTSSIFLNNAYDYPTFNIGSAYLECDGDYYQAISNYIPASSASSQVKALTFANIVANGYSAYLTEGSGRLEGRIIASSTKLLDYKTKGGLTFKLTGVTAVCDHNASTTLLNSFFGHYDVCTKCYKLRDASGEAKIVTHTYKEATSATSTAHGHTAGYDCYCGYKTTKTLHYYEEYAKAEPTCTEYGYKNTMYKCENCATYFDSNKNQISFKEFSKNTIAPLGHDFYTVKAKEPTCTESGTTSDYQKCTRCASAFTMGGTPLGGAKWAAIYRTALGHDLVKVEAIPAQVGSGDKHDEDGSIAHYKCSRCNEKYLDAQGKTKAGELRRGVDDIKLSASSFTYNGKVQKPKVVITDFYTKKTLVEGKDYTVKYENSNSKKVGSYSIKVTFKGDYTGTYSNFYGIKPRVPSKITASQTITTITLKWSKISEADYYRVYKYNTKTKKYEKLKDVTSTSLKIKDLKAGTGYKYKVRAVTKAGDLKIFSDFSAEFATATKTKTPSISSIYSKTKGKAVVKWNNVSGESGYQLYYATSKDGTYKKVKSYSANKTAGSKSKLKSGKKYYFKVRAYKKTASGTVYSSWSAVKSIKIK